MSSHRFLFYSPSLATGDAFVDLDGEERHHLARVVRLGPGEDAFVTNGRGLIAACTVDSVSKERARLSVGHIDEVPRGREVTLALALLRKERFAQALEQCVELGIARCLPFAGERSQLRRYSPAAVERLRRVAVSAMKQSFRAWLPEVEPPVAFEEMVRRAQSGAIVVGDPGGVRPAAPAAGPVTVVVGPEAGLSDAETGALRRAGASFAAVSRHRLRSETAAAALVSAVLLAD